MYRSHVLVCGGTGCTSSGSPQIMDTLKNELKRQGLEEEVAVVETGCHGLCALGPIMIVYPDATFYSMVQPGDIPEIVSEHLLKGRVVTRLLYQETVSPTGGIKALSDTDFYKKQHRIALRNCGVIDPENIEEYIGTGGYQALGKVLTEMTPEDVIQTLLDAGLRGRGGAGFPTNVKLAPKNEEEIDYVIVNGAECEPYLTSDYRVMLEQPEKVVGGLKVILQLFDKAKGVIGIEENKPEAIRILSELVKDEPRIQVCTLKTKYPQGGERFLIYAVTGGREINSTMLPADAGCIVDNIDTVVSIYNAVCETTPLIRRIITVTGDAIREPRNFEVRLGTNYQELIEAAGGFKEEPEKVLSGGPMMGQALFSYDIPVMKTSSALTCLTKDQVAANAETACIRCGRCVDVCPGRVVPQMLMTAAEHHDLAAFEKLNGMECCECGSCTFICPAHRPLTQAFKEMRKAVMAERKKKA